jgi:hypothetical protein
MTQLNEDVFVLSRAELETLLTTQQPLMPELEASRQNPAALLELPHVKILLKQLAPIVQSAGVPPSITYTNLQNSRRTDLKNYDEVLTIKRRTLTALAINLFLQEPFLESSERQRQRDLLQDYIWSMCEDNSWVAPGHAARHGDFIDLWAAETGFLLAEIVALFGTNLDYEIRHRVRAELEKRIFTPYLNYHKLEWWYQFSSNWNSVCNSAIAATFLLAEPDTARTAYALEIAFNGLKVYLDTAFEADGTSTEGTVYWQYGLSNLIFLSEMLYARSGGKLNLLDSSRMRQIAAFPAKVWLAGTKFASFSDSSETVKLFPGLVSRLAQRTGDRSLVSLPVQIKDNMQHQNLSVMLRNVLWVTPTKKTEPSPQPGDAVLPVSGIVRLVSKTKQGTPIGLVVKAGHNAENHNHNDVGSFVLHGDGEVLLTDPGPGMYSTHYWSAQRYENPMVSSYGHSLPVIGGHQQKAGREFAGYLLHEPIIENGSKQVEIEFAKAYGLAELVSARRLWRFEADGSLVIQDQYQFDPTQAALQIEEAFVTWHTVEVAGTTAIIFGRNYNLHLAIQNLPGTFFKLEELSVQQHIESDFVPLRRLSFALPNAYEPMAQVRLEFLPNP